MTDVEVFENYESEVRSYCRSFPAVFTTSKGSIMKDENGKEYIDFFCGAVIISIECIIPSLIRYATIFSLI